ncbi:MAG: Abi family protein [Spirochaetaceae bacterium]|nr:MAG: Abi family protein [Spirochaetaceae bacterium]
MKRHDQREVAVRYQLQPNKLSSWLHHLVYIRNVCAHHSRLWDRRWTIKPTMPPGALWSYPSLQPANSLVSTLLITS